MRGLCTISIFLICVADVHAQNVVNEGVPITIGSEAMLFLPGNYMRLNDDVTALQTKLFLQGELRINGNLVDQDGENLINPGSTGKAILTGANNQYFKSSVPVFIPQLEFRKTGGNVYTQQSFLVDQNITFGNSTRFYPGNARVLLQKASSSLINESNSSYISGTSTVVKSPADFTLVNNLTLTSLLGLGLSANTIGSSSFLTFAISRYHKSLSNVGKRGSINKYYSIESGTNSPVNILRFSYFDADIPAGFREGDFTIFYSHNNGTTWRRLSSSTNAGNNYVQASSLPIKSGTNLVAIAEDCDPVSPSINSSIGRIGGIVNLCGEQSAVLSYSGSPTYYHWEKTGSADTLAANTSVSVNTSGTYKLIVRTARGCEFTYSVVVRKRNLPLSKITYSPNDATHILCEGTRVDFNGSTSTSDGKIVNYYWRTGSNYFSGNENEDVTYRSSGLKRAYLAVRDEFNCYSDTTSVTLDIFPKPTIDFSVSATSVCQEVVVSTTNNSSLEYQGSTYPIQYNWSFQGQGSTEHAPNFEALNTGRDYLKLELQPVDPSITCEVADSVEIEVLPKPVADFEMKLNENTVSQSCEGQIIDFINGSSIEDNSALSSLWQFGDGMSSAESGPEHQYLVASEKNVQLIIKSDVHGCSDTTTQALTVNPVPRGSFFISDYSICAGDTVLIENQTSSTDLISYNWDFGNDTSSNNEIQFSHNYTASGTYHVTLNRLTDKGCQNTVSRTVEVYDNPVVDFQLETDSCEKSDVFFKNLTSVNRGVITGFQWDIGGQLSTAVAEPTHSFPEKGNYLIELVANTQQGCSAIKTDTVKIKPLPIIDHPGPFISCIDSLMISPSSIGVDTMKVDQLNWIDATGDFLSNQQNITLSQSGIYKLELEQSGCKNSYDIPVKIAEKVVVPDTLKFCDTVTFVPSLTPDVQGISWYENDTEISAANQVFLDHSSPVTIVTSYEFLGASCVDTSKFETLRSEPLSFSLPETVDLCEGSQKTLAIDPGDYEPVWYYVDESDTISSSASALIADAGRYDLTVRNEACHFQQSINVQKRSVPAVSFDLEKDRWCQEDQLSAENLTYFPDASGDRLSYEWKLDGVLISEEVNLQKVLSDTGSFQLSLEAQSEYGCQGQSTRQIEVNEIPEIDFALDTSYCQDESLILFANQNAIEYYINGSFYSDQDSAELLLDVEGKLDIQLITNHGQCKAEETFQTVVYPVPHVDFQDTVTSCDSAITISLGNDLLQVQWTDIVQQSIISELNSVTLTQDNYVSVKAVNQWGCSATDTFHVKTGTAPIVDLGHDQQFCHPVTLDAGFFEDGTYWWNTGMADRQLKVDKSGTYSVQVTDNSGCVAFDTVNLIITDLPEFELGPDREYCADEEIYLGDEQLEKAFAWNSGQLAMRIKIDSSGFYYAGIEEGECRVSDSVRIMVNPSPKVTFAKAPVCQNETAILTNLSLEDIRTEYRWYIDSQLIATTDSLYLNASLPADYQVVLEAKNTFGCLAIDSAKLEVLPAPDASFTIGDICVLDTARVIISTAYQIEKWWLENESIESLESLSPNVPGSYQLKRSVTNDANCSATDSRTFLVRDIPELHFPDVASCVDSLLIEIPKEEYLVTWSKGSGNSDILITESGRYDFEIVDESGCRNDQSLEVSINPFSELDFNAKYQACGELTLSHELDDISTYWSTGDKEKTTTLYESDDNVVIRLISNELCVFEDSFSVQIDPIPVISLPNQVDLCANETLTLDASHPEVSLYTWSNGASVPSIEISESGEYLVELQSQAGCRYSDSVSVSIVESPVDMLPDSLISCGPALLNAGNEGSSYEWQNGSISQSIFALQSGTYRVEITNSAGCSLSESIDIIIHEIPTMDLGEDLTQCYGDDIVLEAGEGWDEYFWSTGNEESFLEVESSGNYWVKVWDDNGCSAIDEVEVNFRDPLSTGLSDEQMICSEGGLFLNVDYETVNWFREDVAISETDTITLTEPGSYRVTFADENNCPGDQVFNVRESNEKIQASFLFPSVANLGDLINFNLLTDPVPETALWEFGDGAISTELHPKHRYRRIDTFQVALTVSNGFCEDEIKKDILIADIDLLENNGAFEIPLIEKAVAYPNPTTNKLTIHLQTSQAASTQIYVLDMSGEILMFYERLVNDDLLEVNTSSLSSGSYLLAIAVGQQMELLRFIKN